MTESVILRGLENVGALRTDGHFVFPSGRHSDTFVDMDRVHAFPLLMNTVANELASRFARDAGNIQVVVGVDRGGITLGHNVARLLNRFGGDEDPQIMAGMAEKDGSGFALLHGYDKDVAGRKVLVVVDIVMSGDSVRSAVTAVKACGGNVVAVAAMANREGTTADQLGIPRLECLLNLKLHSWDPPCKLCTQRVPLNTDIGHGRRVMSSLGAGTEESA